MRTDESGANTSRAAERALEVIEKTIALIEDPARWIRGIAASARGRECDAGNGAATEFCLYTAMRRAAGTTGNDAAGEAPPGLRDVHDAIERRLWRANKLVRYKRETGKPAALLIAWNDEPEVCSHEDVLEVLVDAAKAVRIRGRALENNDEPQQPLLSTGNRRLDDALWNLCDTLSNGEEGNGELIDRGVDVLTAWRVWQTGMK